MYKHLTREQRYAIYLGLQRGATLLAIAREINVSVSTVSREIKRNSTTRGKYVWDKADAKAERRKTRSPGNRATDELLRWRIRQLILEKQWSPRQIAGWLARNGGVRISHETIYAMIRNDASGQLAANCRHKMKYKKTKRKKKPTKATNIKDRVSIHDRPEEADGRRFGDWEMDLIVDSHANAIITLVERSTNFLIMEKLKQGKKALPLAKTVWRLLLPYTGEALKTITTDNGSEFAEHKWITKKLGVPVFFADSYCSWQKGAVENANKLIRQYIPKGTDIARIPEQRIKNIAKKLNKRPRQKLLFRSPVEVFFNNINNFALVT